MSFNSEDIKSITLTIDADPVGDGKLYHLLKAPRDLTVISAYMTAFATQNAGTAVCLTLLNYGTAGDTLQTGGTVVAKIGGTATAEQLTAYTPAAGVVNADQAYIHEGEWLVVRENEEGAGWIANDRFSYTLNYVIGKGA
jgi:hypothetical protein